MKKIVTTLFSLLFVFSLTASYAQTTGTDADHEELRNLLSKSAKAINDNNFDELQPLLDTWFTITTIDNNKFNSLDSFKAYWDSMLKGDKAKLKGISVKPVADEKTHFIGPDVGIVSGTAEETFSFTDGDVRTINTRWTAVVHKENNQWKIMNIHFSGNILDNPVLTALKADLFKTAAITGVIGLLIGLILMRLMGRTKTA